MRTYQIETAGLTDIGQTRSVNEDQLISEGDLFAVADGMGGLGHGEVAANMVLEHLRAGFIAKPTVDGLVEAVGRANQAVYDHSLELADGSASSPPERPMGSTLAAVAYVGGDDNGNGADGNEQLVVVNVGDSRVYRLRNGRLHQLTTDHSKVAELVRAGSLNADQAAEHPERHILTRAIGVGPDVEAAVNLTEPSPGDRLLLCSDGLHNEVPDVELAELLASDDPAETVAAGLVQLANERGGPDNITALVLDVV